MPNGSVHWFSILNSLLVVLVMSVIVAVILMRTVRRDLAKYEELLVEGQVRAVLVFLSCISSVHS
jgi:transmembrane 9 superfamily member 2/4